jgi:type VI secretion system protein ImpG
VDPRLLECYDRELQFVREMSVEFARTYPRIATRLGIDRNDPVACEDPYVERLIEAFAFLAARVQLKIQARHPEFTQHLLEMIYPHFLCPVPSFAIADFQPDMKDAALANGILIPRGSTLRTPLSKGEKTACEFRTAHDVRLWPLQIVDARYLSGGGALSTQGIAVDPRLRAAIRLRLKCAPGVKLAALPLDTLDLFIKAVPAVGYRLYEQIAANCIGYYVRPNQTGSRAQFRPAVSVQTVGLDDEHALLPVTRQGFSGYRLLQEYFAFPDRLMYFAVRDLAGTLRDCEGDEFDLYLALDRAESKLENALDASQFRLHSTPIVNLFPKEFDRIHVAPYDTEQHVIPDRNRPMDFEVFSLDRVSGIGRGGERLLEILPFYAANHRNSTELDRAYYSIQRRKRLYSEAQSQSGARSSYIGTECFISLVDSRQRTHSGELRQIDLHGLCTNRDLPILLAKGKGRTDLMLEGAAPLEAIRFISGPSEPRFASGFEDTAWRLISHLSLNHLSLSDTNPQMGAELLREMLSLYAPKDAALHHQIEGVRSIAFRSVVRRIPLRGPISYGRGLEIDLTLDDQAFEGVGILPLAAVVERFLARYVTLNSFTQLKLLSQTRGEVKKWPVRLGSRQII